MAVVEDYEAPPTEEELRELGLGPITYDYNPPAGPAVPQGTEDAPPTPEELRALGLGPLVGPDDTLPTEWPEPPPASLGKSVKEAGARMLYRAAAMPFRQLEALDPHGGIDIVDTQVRKAIDWAERGEAKHYLPPEEGFLRGGLPAGIESAGESLTGRWPWMAAGGVGGFMIGGPPGVIPGMAALGAAGTYLSFGLSEYSRSMDEAVDHFTKQGMSEDEVRTDPKVRTMALRSATIEGGGEALDTAISSLALVPALRGLKVAKVARGAKKASTLDSILSPTMGAVLKGWLTKQAITVPSGMTTEYLQEFGQAKLRGGMGMPTEDPHKAGVHGAQAAFWMSTIFGSVAQTIDTVTHKRMRDRLSTPPKTHKDALLMMDDVAKVARGLRDAGHNEAAEDWVAGASYAINNGEGIPINVDLGEYGAGKIDEVINEITNKNKTWANSPEEFNQLMTHVAQREAALNAIPEEERTDADIKELEIIAASGGDPDVLARHYRINPKEQPIDVATGDVGPENAETAPMAEEPTISTDDTTPIDLGEPVPPDLGAGMAQSYERVYTDEQGKEVREKWVPDVPQDLGEPQMPTLPEPEQTPLAQVVPVETAQGVRFMAMDSQDRALGAFDTEEEANAAIQMMDGVPGDVEEARTALGNSVFIARDENDNYLGRSDSWEGASDILRGAAATEITPEEMDALSAEEVEFMAELGPEELETLAPTLPGEAPTTRIKRVKRGFRTEAPGAGVAPEGIPAAEAPAEEAVPAAESAQQDRGPLFDEERRLEEETPEGGTLVGAPWPDDQAEEARLKEQTYQFMETLEPGMILQSGSPSELFWVVIGDKTGKATKIIMAMETGEALPAGQVVELRGLQRDENDKLVRGEDGRPLYADELTRSNEATQLVARVQVVGTGGGRFKWGRNVAPAEETAPAEALPAEKKRKRGLRGEAPGKGKAPEKVPAPEAPAAPAAEAPAAPKEEKPYGPQPLKRLKETKEHTRKAIDEALEGLDELFGGGRMGIVYKGVTKESYALAKPKFERAWAHLAEAGNAAARFVIELQEWAARKGKDWTEVQPFVQAFIAEKIGNKVEFDEAQKEAPAPPKAKAPKAAKPAKKELAPEEYLDKVGVKIYSTRARGREVEEIAGFPYEIVKGEPLNPKLKEAFGKDATGKNRISWYGPKKVWTVWSLPGGKTAAEIVAGVLKSAKRASQPGGRTAGGPGTAGGGKGDVVGGPRGGRPAPTQPTVDKPISADVPGNVDDTTSALIKRGAKFGIPEEALNWQLEDIALTVATYKRGDGLFVLANAAGSGKTFVLGGIIKELKALGQDKFIYVTINEPLIAQNKRDLNDYGMENVQFATYAKLSKGAGNLDADGAVIIFDESQNIKNPTKSQRAAVAAGLMSRAKMTILASATPYENPVQMAYLEPTGIFEEAGGFKEWAVGFGATIRKFPNVYGKDMEEFNKWAGTVEQARAARQWMIDKGVKTNRPMRLPIGQVDSRFKKYEAPQEIVDIYKKVNTAYEAALETTIDPKDSTSIMMHRENLLKRILETGKIDGAVDRAEELVKEGRYVVVFTETKADRRLGLWQMSERDGKRPSKEFFDYPQMVEMMEEWRVEANMAMTMGDSPPPRPFAPFIFKIAGEFHDAGIRYDLPSVPESIRKGLAERGIDSGAYHGGKTPKKNDTNLVAWKNKKFPVLVATMAKGGTGLSLHDTKGDRPTGQIVMNLPWVATGVDQVAGRTARYGMIGRVFQDWVFSGNIPFDVRLARKVGRRMQDMGASVSGVDVPAGRRVEAWDFEHDEEAFLKEAEEGAEVYEPPKEEAVVEEKAEEEKETRPAEEAPEEAGEEEPEAIMEEIAAGEYGRIPEGIEVTVKVIREKTGQEIPMQEDAVAALQDADATIETYNEIIDSKCLS